MPQFDRGPQAPWALRFSPPTSFWTLHAPLPHPYLRPAPRDPYRRDRSPVRLVPPYPRPWRGAVHRPARPLRHHPMRGRSGLAGVCRGREAALGMGGADGRQGPPPPRGHRQYGTADRPDRALRQRHRGAGPGRRIAAAGVRRAGISRGYPPEIPVPRPAAREAAPEHHDPRPNHRFHTRADEAGRVLRVPDTDPDRVLA